MRRHVVSTIYNNFIYMYINLFKKRYLSNGLPRKTKNSCTEFLGSMIIKDGREYKWEWERQLENFSKRIQEEENMT